MKRSKKLVVLSHCLLNANAKVEPYAGYQGVNLDVLSPYINEGYGIIQLPCPESSYLGLDRWGMTKNQYDHPAYRRHCQQILQPSLDQIEAAVKAGYNIAGVIGIKGSPNCGVMHSCQGFQGGEIDKQRIESQFREVKITKEAGVFMEVLQQELDRRNLVLEFREIED